MSKNINGSRADLNSFDERAVSRSVGRSVLNAMSVYQELQSGSRNQSHKGKKKQTKDDKKDKEMNEQTDAVLVTLSFFGRNERKAIEEEPTDDLLCFFLCVSICLSVCVCVRVS